MNNLLILFHILQSDGHLAFAYGCIFWADSAPNGIFQNLYAL